jgi:hypothetical protein
MQSNLSRLSGSSWYDVNSAHQLAKEKEKRRDKRVSERKEQLETIRASLTDPDRLAQVDEILGNDMVLREMHKSRFDRIVCSILDGSTAEMRD